MLTRMFQLLPSVCKHMPISFRNALFGILNPKRNNVNWFHDLFALGILASKAVLRWWQNATFNVVENLVQSGGLSSALKDIISAFLMPGNNSSLLFRLRHIVNRWLGVNTILSSSCLQYVLNSCTCWLEVIAQPEVWIYLYFGLRWNIKVFMWRTVSRMRIILGLWSFLGRTG